MTALAKLPEKWRATAEAIAKPYGFVTEHTLGKAEALSNCADELTAALSPAEMGGVERDVQRALRALTEHEWISEDGCASLAANDIANTIRKLSTPQPAQAGVAKPLGYVLESDLAQLDANDSGTIWPFPAEATDQISGKRCGSVPVYLTPASPATGEGEVTDTMANALLDYIPFPNDPEFNFCIGNLLASHPAFYKKRSVGEVGLETLRTAREAIAAVLAQAPHTPQPAAAQGGDAFRKFDDLLYRLAGQLGSSRAHFDYKIVNDYYRELELIRTALAAAPQPQPPINSAETYSNPIGAPAHGDGEGGCTCPSGDGSLRWPCPKHPPSLDTNVAAVHRKLDERSAKGVREYGVTTDGAGLSRLDWLLHLQEELIDGAVYVQAALTTRPTPEAQEARDAARYRLIRDAVTGANAAALKMLEGEAPSSAEAMDARVDAALALPAQGEGKECENCGADDHDGRCEGSP